METKFYYIYEIWGKKIGCAENVEHRIKQQKIIDGRYEILEIYTDIMLASQREIELQKEYGYRVDRIPYWKALEMAKKGTSPKARAKIDYITARAKAVANTDYKAIIAKIDYSKIDYVAARTKAVANTDLKARNKKLEKPINQLTLDGVFIQKHDSALKAGLALGKQKTDDIGAVCRGRAKQAFGFKWEFANK